MMIARGKKAIKPFPGLWAAKRIAGATPLNIIAASAPGNLPNYCRITRRKEILPQFFRWQDQSLSSLVRATSWVREDLHSATDDPLPDAPEAQKRTARGSQTR